MALSDTPRKVHTQRNEGGEVMHPSSIAVAVLVLFLALPLYAKYGKRFDLWRRHR
jgi:hypothetical protein